MIFTDFVWIQKRYIVYEFRILSELQDTEINDMSEKVKLVKKAR
jgi:hypothetical protein